MFSDNLVIADAAAANKTFAKISQSGQESRRIDNSSTTQEPRLLTIRHQIIVVKGITYDRHNLVFNKIRVGSDGFLHTTSISTVMQESRDSAAASDILDLVAFSKNFLATSGVVTSLRLGES